MDQDTLEKIVREVIEESTKLKSKNTREDQSIMIEASGRHMHLTREDIDTLFGKGYELKKRKDLSQPGQYICEERLTLIGPKGVIENVGIIGPERKHTQVELSKTDARILGVNPPIRDSGDTEGSETLFIASNRGVIQAKESTIIAKRHIHMTKEDAEYYGVKDKDLVSVEVLSERGLVFNNVLIRVNDNFSLSMHIDYDEANAIDYNLKLRGKIIT